jgi:hypothetical protein
LVAALKAMDAEGVIPDVVIYNTLLEVSSGCMIYAWMHLYKK